MSDDVDRWLQLVCRRCSRSKRVWGGTCVLVTPPVSQGGGDWCMWTCGQCGPQRLDLAMTNLVQRFRVYEVVWSRLQLMERPVCEGPLRVEDVGDVELDLWELGR